MTTHTLELPPSLPWLEDCLRSYLGSALYGLCLQPVDRDFDYRIRLVRDNIRDIVFHLCLR